ncbi:MAG: hypothetical protein N3F07_01455 [Candidatus Micrarchaeota archaeon]|nr:hypothetical protein [Candidatus Micrarchaeota archaeon]
MSEEVKNEILRAWNRHLALQEQRHSRNEWSSAQAEDYKRIFKEGIMRHSKLSKKEKNELLAHIGFPPMRDN